MSRNALRESRSYGCAPLLNLVQNLSGISQIGIVELGLDEYVLVVQVDVDFTEVGLHVRKRTSQGLAVGFHTITHPILHRFQYSKPI